MDKPIPADPNARAAEAEARVAAESPMQREIREVRAGLALLHRIPAPSNPAHAVLRYADDRLGTIYWDISRARRRESV